MERDINRFMAYKQYRLSGYQRKDIMVDTEYMF